METRVLLSQCIIKENRFKTFRVCLQYRLNLNRISLRDDMWINGQTAVPQCALVYDGSGYADLNNRLLENFLEMFFVYPKNCWAATLSLF